jgi:riboflavin kinase/FMN adenylyltransferase
VDVIHFPDDARAAGWRDPVLALGNFDGLHRGHRKILDRLRRVAASARHVRGDDVRPASAAGREPDKAPPLLMTKAQKLEGLAQIGVDGAAIVRFTHELSQWSPEAFVRTVLVEWLRVSEVWVGANFLFGHDRSGNFSLLRARRALRFQGRKDRSGPTRTSSSAARGSGVSSAKRAWTRRARSSGTRTSSTAPS